MPIFSDDRWKSSTHLSVAIFTCSLLVASCCCTALQGQGVSFQYIAEDSTIEYTESGAGEGDVAFHIVQDGGPADVVMAWSMGVNFDPDQLFLYGVNPGSSVAEFNGGLGPDFWMTSNSTRDSSSDASTVRSPVEGVRSSTACKKLQSPTSARFLPPSPVTPPAVPRC